MKLPEPKKLPSGAYRIRLLLGDKRISITRPTKEECIDAAELEKLSYKHGLNLKKPGAYISLENAIDNYIEARENVLSPSTIRGYKAIKKNRFTAYQKISIGAINWQKAVNAEAKEVSPKTLKNSWMLIRSVLAENGLDVSVRLPALVPHEKEWLTPEQIPLFMSAIRGKPGEIGALLALSGLRRSEIYGLDWKDVDLDKRIIKVRQSMLMNDEAEMVIRDRNKTASSTRKVPIFIPRLYDALYGVSDKTGYVVTGNVGTLKKRVESACKKAGLPIISVHELRHSFCSLCYSLGISELGAMRLGGWNDYQTMRKVYTHLSEKDMDTSAEKLKNYFTLDTKLDTPEEESYYSSQL